MAVSYWWFAESISNASLVTIGLLVSYKVTDFINLFPIPEPSRIRLVNLFIQYLYGYLIKKKLNCFYCASTINPPNNMGSASNRIIMVRSDSLLVLTVSQCHSRDGGGMF